MDRVWWLALALALGGCIGELELSSPDAGGGGAPPQIELDDAGVPLPGQDAGGVLPEGLDAGPPPMLDAGPPSTTWHAVLLTGDRSISAFDNARETVRDMFLDEGVLAENMIELSRDSRMQTDGVRDTTVDNVEAALTELDIGEGDGCVVFMTSHGNTTGFSIEGRGFLTPNQLDAMLDATCGTRPTVVLVSACYSGVFVAPVQAPNRIILTAAREDRTSFGCSSEVTYTYWDGCLISEWEAATTWQGLYDEVSKCIERKEGSGFTPSYPQGFFGADVADLPIFGR
ncbi:MAG: hypothetical protein H6719_21705 [Sandaracinaceae bacterium]|nr:hypothetical protein [Sandaracinaceae bacterium]